MPEQSPSASVPPPPDLHAVLRLFDETTAALSGQVRRLEQVLVQKSGELQETNERLASTNAWLDLVLGAVASGVIAVDRAGEITTCNRVAEDLLAQDLPDPVGADYAQAFPDSPLLGVLAGAGAADYERSVQTRDGGRRILACSAAPLRSPTGELLGAVEVFEDVSELLRLREQSERADRLKQLGAMAAGVAHEIRNPLNGIEGFASLLARDLAASSSEDDQRRRRWAEAVITGVRELNRTVSGLLEFTRPRRIERRSADPVQLAQAVVDLVQAGQEADATVVVRLIDRWPTRGPISVDGAQIKQVLLNLVQNAVHACTEHTGKGTVTLSVEPEEPGRLAYTIDDDGPGIPAEQRPHLFTPFHTTRDQGTGLGLAIAQTIVQLHGGAITVGESPSGGACFRVVI